MNENDDITVRLRWCYGLNGVCGEAADLIEQLRKERDEARRELATMVARARAEATQKIGPQMYARERGWDCFPQEDGK